MPEAPDRAPAPEMELARDLARRAALVAPALVLAAALIWGRGGALSALVAVALVAANFLGAAAIMGWAVRISAAVLYASVMAGYVGRLVLMTVVVLAIKDLSWVEVVPLALTLVVTHLGLLVWETRYVSLSLAHPGLAPQRSPVRPDRVPAQEGASPRS